MSKMRPIFLRGKVRDVEDLSSDLRGLNNTLGALGSSLENLGTKLDTLATNLDNLNEGSGHFWKAFEEWASSSSEEFRRRVDPEFTFISQRINAIMREDGEYVLSMYRSIKRVSDDDYAFAIILMYVLVNRTPYNTHRDDIKLLKMPIVPRKFIEINIITFGNKMSIIGLDRDIFSKSAKKSLICLQYDNLIDYNNVFKSRKKSNVEIRFKFKNVDSMVLENSALISSKPFKRFEHRGIVYTHSDSFESLHEVKILKAVNRNTANFNIDTCIKLSKTKIKINKKYLPQADSLLSEEVVKIKEELASMGLWLHKAPEQENYTKIKNELRKLEVRRAIATTKINSAKEDAKNLKVSDKEEAEGKAKVYLSQKKKIKNRISKISSNVSKLMYIENTRRLFKLDHYYVQHIVDFRGRIYSNSILSPTFNKIIRPLICFEQEINEMETISSEYYKKLSKILEISDIEDYYRALIKIDIGKLYSKDIIKENKKTSISVKEFIEKADEIIKRNSVKRDELDLDEKILLQILLDNAKRESFEPLDNYVPGLYDSTASGQQVLSKYLKVTKNKKLINLDGDEWVDTYEVAVNMIKEHLNKESCDENIIKNLNRKVLKPAIMTSFYNATSFTTNKNIKEKLDDSSIDNKELYKISKKIHNFLRTDYVKSILGVNSLAEITPNEHILKEIDVKYYKSSTKEERIRITIEKKTMSHSYEIKTKNIEFLWSTTDDGYLLKKKYKIDQDKTNTAVIANIAHHLDSMVVKELCTIQNIYPIHDMFITNIKNKHKLYDKLNKLYNNNKEYGLFILK